MPQYFNSHCSHFLLSVCHLVKENIIFKWNFSNSDFSVITRFKITCICKWSLYWLVHEYVCGFDVFTSYKKILFSKQIKAGFLKFAFLICIALKYYLKHFTKISFIVCTQWNINEHKWFNIYSVISYYYILPLVWSKHKKINVHFFKT